MNPDPNIDSIINTQKISTQKISTQIIDGLMISAGLVPASMSRRRVEVPAGDIDTTIAIMDTLASFCATDPAGHHLARLFGPHIHAFDIATLADGLSAMFTERLTTPVTSAGTEP